MNKVWVVIAINKSTDDVNAWVYNEFAGVKVFGTKEAAEKYVASKGRDSDTEFIIREEVVN
jgi:hypothetical protein